MAHETHLNQPLSDFQLPVDDLLTVLGVLAQGLFAEAPLLLRQGFHDVVVVSRVNGSDDHRFHLGVFDHAVTVASIGFDAIFGSGVVRRSRHIIADRHHRGAGDGLDDTAAVVLANGSAADDANF